MKTNTCRIASKDAVVLSEDSRIEMHRQCPRAYVDEESGKVESCDCECHAGEDPPEMLDRKALPVLSSAVSAPRPEEPSVDRPVRPRARGGGSSCECGCGRATGGKFAPGHDAKLKSNLMAQGTPNAWAEILLRHWSESIPRGRWPEQEIRERGMEIAAEKGYAFVVERTQARQVNTVST